jgi:hypothetical protein
MKIRLLLFFLFTIHLSGFCQGFLQEYISKGSNTKDLIQKNNIQRERIFSYTFRKKGIKDSSLFASLEYDSMGNMIRKLEAKPYEDKITTIRYEYNPDHSIHRKMTDYPAPATGTSIEEYVYDSVGNIDQVYTYNPDTTSLVIEKNVYDEKRQLISRYTRKGSGEFFLTKRYYYSEDGRSSKEESFNGLGAPGNYNVKEYDSTLNKTSWYVETKTGKEPQGTYFLDSTGRCIRYVGALKEIPFPGNTTIDHPVTEEFTYNPDGTVFECNGIIDNKDHKIFRHYYYVLRSPQPQ